MMRSLRSCTSLLSVVVTILAVTMVRSTYAYADDAPACGDSGAGGAPSLACKAHYPGRTMFPAVESIYTAPLLSCNYLPPDPFLFFEDGYSNIYIHSNQYNDDPKLMKKLRDHKIESIELRYYTNAVGKREGQTQVQMPEGLYFEAIYHVPNQGSWSIGGNEFRFCVIGSELIIRHGFSELDYQSSHGHLTQAVENLYSSVGFFFREAGRVGVPALAAFGTLRFLVWVFAKREWGAISQVFKQLETLYKGNPKAASGASMVLLIGGQYIWDKYTSGHKKMADLIDKGEFVFQGKKYRLPFPFEHGVKGEELMERGWLYDILYQGNELGHGRRGDFTRLDQNLMDQQWGKIEKGEKLYDPSKDPLENSLNPAGPEKPRPFHEHVGVGDMNSALKSIQSFFTKYYVRHSADKALYDALEKPDEQPDEEK